MPERLAPKSTKVSSQTKSISVSSLAKRGICFFFGRAAIFCLAALLSGSLHEASSAAQEPIRPRILRIVRADIIVSDLPEGRSWYQSLLYPDRSCSFCEELPSRNFVLASGQLIQLDFSSSPTDTSFLSGVTLATDDLKKMKQFLEFQKIPFKEEKRDGEISKLSLVDPESHRISFMQGSSHFSRTVPGLPAFRLIHVGFVVHDRAAIDHFYKEILGFRPYWHGGMKDDQTDWVSLQVPDGTDWVEFMVNVPLNADKSLLGVMNHIALGVPDIHAAAKQLLTNGMKLTEEPKIGRDGKWQLNLYDPDQTRVELMEFTPVEKPCCSDYTGPHPKP